MCGRGIKLYHFFELTGGMSLVGATAGVVMPKTSGTGFRRQTCSARPPHLEVYLDEDILCSMREVYLIEHGQAVEAILRHSGPQVRFQPFVRAEGPLAGGRRHKQRGEDVKEPGDDWE